MEKFELMNYRALRLEVSRIRETLASLETFMYSPDGQRFTLTPRASSGSNRRTMDDLVDKHLSLEAAYREKLAEKADRLLAIERAIEGIDSAEERLVIRLRYIDGRSWASICTQLHRKGYSERQVYRLHGQALLKLKEV